MTEGTHHTCQACGAQLAPGVKVCPHCGARQRRAPSASWVLAFFIMGILIGLMLLILKQGELPQWLQPEWAEHGIEKVKKSMAGGDSGTSAQPQTAPVQASKTEQEAMLCDRDEALAVRDKALTIATFRDEGEHLTLMLGKAWAYYAEGHKRGFVEAVADADRCLSGHGREITFSYRGKIVAVARANGAIELR